LYASFAMMTGLEVRHIPDYAQVFRVHGFHCDQQAHYLAGLVAAEVWER
jgi:hypothetical protein